MSGSERWRIVSEPTNPMKVAVPSIGIPILNVAAFSLRELIDLQTAVDAEILIATKDEGLGEVTK